MRFAAESPQDAGRIPNGAGLAYGSVAVNYNGVRPQHQGGTPASAYRIGFAQSQSLHVPFRCHTVGHQFTNMAGYHDERQTQLSKQLPASR